MDTNIKSESLVSVILMDVPKRQRIVCIISLVMKIIAIHAGIAMVKTCLSDCLETIILDWITMIINVVTLAVVKLQNIAIGIVDTVQNIYKVRNIVDIRDAVSVFQLTDCLITVANINNVIDKGDVVLAGELKQAMPFSTRKNDMVRLQII